MPSARRPRNSKGCAWNTVHGYMVIDRVAKSWSWRSECSMLLTKRDSPNLWPTIPTRKGRARVGTIIRGFRVAISR